MKSCWQELMKDNNAETKNGNNVTIRRSQRLMRFPQNARTLFVIFATLISC
jgi:hypothetical protein